MQKTHTLVTVLSLTKINVKFYNSKKKDKPI